MDQKQPLGFLFDSVAYYSEESIETMLDSLDIKSVSYILSQALHYAHQKNCYNLLESEVISKSLRILNKEIYSNDDTTGLSTSDVEDNQS